jgi:PBSX family phage terminase large subunit
VNLDSLPLSRKQVLSIAASMDARISLWSGAVRSGKTIGSLVAFLIHLSKAPPSGLLLICGRTLQTIERNIIEPLQDPALFGPVADLVQHTRGASTATILGRTVHLVGASDTRAEARIRGLTAYLVLIDEATLVPEGFFNQALARLSVTGAKALLTTNPDGPGHWLRKNFILRAAELGVAHFHFTLDDNPTLDPAYVEAIKAEFTGLWYRRMVLGEWCMAEGAIFDMWDPDRHVVDELPPMWRWIALGVDYGTSNAFAGLLLGVHGADLYLAAEWRYDSKVERRSLTDVEYSARLKAWLRDLQPPGAPQRGVTPEMVAVDPSAASFMQQLFRDGLAPTPADNSVNDGIRLMSSLLSSGRLRVHRSCKGLIDEIPGYSWDPKKALAGVDAPIKALDHSIDAARYAVVTSESSWRRPTGITVPQVRMPADYVDLTSAAM